MSEKENPEPKFWGELPGDDRRWFIYIYPDGRIQAVDPGSPTGYKEWITADQLNAATERARR